MEKLFNILLDLNWECIVKSICNWGFVIKILDGGLEWYLLSYVLLLGFKK